MSRIHLSELIAALVVVLIIAVWSVHAQTGQPGTAGSAGTAGTAGAAGRPGVAGAPGQAGPAGIPGTASQAGRPGQPVPGGQSAASQAAIPGQSGASSNFDPAGQRQGQFAPTGQPGNFGQPTNVGPAPGFGRVPATGFFNFNAVNTIAPTPWFTDLGARRQLQLNQLQFDQLTRAYLDAWGRYNESVTGLAPNLAPQERLMRLRALESEFNRDFGRTLDTTITDPRVRQRFNQLNLQRQGFGAFNNAQFQQQLGLTPTQQQRIRLMAHQWNQQMRLLQQQAANNPSVWDEEFNELRQQARQQIAIVLTPQQQQIWPQLVGPYYEFPANMFFDTAGRSAPATSNQRDSQQPVTQQPVPAPPGAISPQDAVQSSQPTSPTPVR
jgi:hypothetical protein